MIYFEKHQVEKKNKGWKIFKKRSKKVFDSFFFLINRSDLVIQTLLLKAKKKLTIKRFPELSKLYLK